MALLFIDSFDHYRTADIGRKYHEFSSSTSIVSVEDVGGIEPRNGTQCMNFSTSSGVSKHFDQHSIWIMGVGIRVTGTIGGSSDDALFSISDKTASVTQSTQVTFAFDGNKKFTVLRGNTTSGTQLAISDGTFDLDDGNWHFVEFKCVIHETTGSFSAQYDGIVIAGLTKTNQDTVNGGGNNFANHIGLGGLINPPSNDAYCDDYYIANGATPGVTAMLGDMKVDALFPKADGNYEEFTSFPVQDDAFTLVNKLPPDDDITYVESNVDGEKSTFDMDDALLNQTIHGVQHTLYIRKSDVNRRKIKHLTRIAGADHLGDLVRMGDKFTMKTKMWEINPQTGSQWTASQVNGAEFGMEVNS